MNLKQTFYIQVHFTGVMPFKSFFTALNATKVAEKLVVESYSEGIKKSYKANHEIDNRATK